MLASQTMVVKIRMRVTVNHWTETRRDRNLLKEGGQENLSRSGVPVNYFTQIQLFSASSRRITGYITLSQISREKYRGASSSGQVLYSRLALCYFLELMRVKSTEIESIAADISDLRCATRL